MKLVMHNKTGNIYKILSENVIDTTNARGGDVEVILYQNLQGQIFVREKQEFWEKFTLL